MGPDRGALTLHVPPAWEVLKILPCIAKYVRKRGECRATTIDRTVFTRQVDTHGG